jgi:hypothetical protein
LGKREVVSWRVLVRQILDLLLQPAKELCSRDGRTRIDAGLNVTLEFFAPLEKTYGVIKQFASVLVRARFQLVLNELFVFWANVTAHGLSLKKPTPDPVYVDRLKHYSLKSPKSMTPDRVRLAGDLTVPVAGQPPTRPPETGGGWLPTWTVKPVKTGKFRPVAGKQGQITDDR